MPEKPSTSEEEYFAKREAELRAERRKAAEAAARDAERQAHYMKCPKCGGDLKVKVLKNVEIDQCVECDGIWFDAGEADLLMEKEKAGIAVFKTIFKGLAGGSSSS